MLRCLHVSTQLTLPLGQWYCLATRLRHKPEILILRQRCQQILSHEQDVKQEKRRWIRDSHSREYVGLWRLLLLGFSFPYCSSETSGTLRTILWYNAEDGTLLEMRRCRLRASTNIRKHFLDLYSYLKTVVMVVHERGFEHASHSPTSFNVTSVTVALINTCHQLKRQSLSSPWQAVTWVVCPRLCSQQLGKLTSFEGSTCRRWGGFGQYSLKF